MVQPSKSPPTGPACSSAATSTTSNGVVPQEPGRPAACPAARSTPNFDPGEPRAPCGPSTTRPGQNLLYAGGDFDSIQIPSGHRLRRPDNDASCGTPPAQGLHPARPRTAASGSGPRSSPTTPRTGVVDRGFQGPTSTGPGLIGQGGKACSSGSTTCGTGAVLSIQLSPDKRQLFASGSFSEMDNSEHKNTIMALYADGPNRGKLTPWQPQAPNGIPIFDAKVGPDTGMLFGRRRRRRRPGHPVGPPDRLRRHQLPRPGLDAPLRR